jgi:hypothetical protein
MLLRCGGGVAGVRQPFMLDGEVTLFPGAGCDLRRTFACHASPVQAIPGPCLGEHPSDTIIWDHCREVGTDGVTFGEMRWMPEVFHCGKQPSMGE